MSEMPPADRSRYDPHGDTGSMGGLKAKAKKKALLESISGLLLWEGTGHAQQQTFRDVQGRTIGTASKSGNTTIFRDARGRTTGTSTTDSQGTTIFRDSQGRATGTTSR